MRPGALKLPPANSLVAFEATARHLSFKEAAKELKVTAAALSRQIRILETDLGCRLFERLHRAIRLTAEGRRLQQAVASGLGSIAACAGELRVPERSNRVTVGSSFTVAMLWLLPRLARFNLARPDIDLRYVVSDSFRDGAEADVDILLRYGNGAWSGYIAHRMFADELIAVCSPEYLRQRPPLSTPADLLKERLIHLDDADPSWEDWPAWFRKQGIDNVPPPRGEGMSSYVLVLQAALEGLGIALGRRRLIEDHLRQGRLVPAVPASVRSDGAYYQLLRERRATAPDVDSLRRWIAEEADAAA